jgi:hypothetical protein
LVFVTPDVGPPPALALYVENADWIASGSSIDLPKTFWHSMLHLQAIYQSSLVNHKQLHGRLLVNLRSVADHGC